MTTFQHVSTVERVEGLKWNKILFNSIFSVYKIFWVFVVQKIINIRGESVGYVCYLSQEKLYINGISVLHKFYQPIER